MALAIHFLSAKPTYLTNLKKKKDKEHHDIQDETTNQPLGEGETEELNKIIVLLNEVNNPLKNIGGVLQRIHLNEELDAAILDAKMKNIIDYSTLSRMEKDFQDQMSELKDHAKQLKLVSSFLNDMGKTFSSISRDILKLAHSARNNMNKNSSLEHKEDLIINNWWQALQVDCINIFIAVYIGRLY